MAFVQSRQPFGVLDDSRLQTLGSIKNRQNNILSHTPMKAPSSAPAKRRLASDMLADDLDSENVDPNILLSPSKRSKALDGTPTKISKFVLTSSPAVAAPAFSGLNPASKRKAAVGLSNGPLSASVPTTTTSTPISNLRGSPPSRRIHLLGGKRRSSLTPYRRIDPLSKSSSSSALPFSIDAALSGTISSYSTPIHQSSAAVITETPLPAPALSAKSSKSMPNSWFFAIHEDTADQEATNLMEHSASTLDISSDDDVATSRAKDASERGKENIPPPEYTGLARPARGTVPRPVHKGIACPKKAAKYAAMSLESMVEDRIALREMDVAAFVKEGEEGASINVVETPEKSLPEVEKPVIVEQEVLMQDKPVQELEPIVIREDTPERITAELPVAEEQTSVQV